MNTWKGQRATREDFLATKNIVKRRAKKRREEEHRKVGRANSAAQSWEVCHSCPYACQRPEECVHACMNIGPLDSADQEDLEKLYTQAKEAYYSGSPLLSDDDYDSIEASLRYQRSSVVSKWPRCSLRGLKVYSDAEIDKGQAFILAGFWAFVCFVTSLVVSFNIDGTLHSNAAQTINVIAGSALFLVSWSCLSRVVNGNEVAMKGFCPNCGEEVYTFVTLNNEKLDQGEVESECHNCHKPLIFKVAKHQSDMERQFSNSSWCYGRIYSKNTLDEYFPSQK